MLSKEELTELIMTDTDAFNKAMTGEAVDLTEIDFSNSSIRISPTSVLRTRIKISPSSLPI